MATHTSINSSTELAQTRSASQVTKGKSFIAIGWIFLLLGCRVSLAQDSTNYIRANNNDSVIVFVHGLLGDADTTWTNPSTKAFWPDLIKQDPFFTGFDIYMYRYSSPLLQNSYTIDELVEDLRRNLEDSEVFLKHKKVIFLCHSMGGVIVREFLIRYQSREYASKVPMIYFFSTPTMGAEIASLATLLSKNPQIKGLRPIESNEHLASIQKNWLAAKFLTASYCAYETQDTYGIRVVRQESATILCDQRLDPINANHFDIVKPKDSRDTPYISFRSAVRETLDLPKKAGQTRGAGVRVSHPAKEPPAAHGSEKPGISGTTDTVNASAQHHGTVDDVTTKKTLQPDVKKAQPARLSPKDRAITLAEEIQTWVNPRMQQRADKGNAAGDNELQVRNEFDQKGRGEFTAKFAPQLSETVNELDKCNADTKRLKENIQTPTRLEHYVFIAMELRSAAHSIPNGQPECGTGVPTEGFGEKDTGLYMFLLGGSEAEYYKEDLEKGPSTTTLGGKHTFRIYLRNGIFCIDAKVYGGFGMPLIDVVCNRIGEPPNGWDTNYTDKAIEVVDQNQVPMFQMIFEGQRRIRVNGVFPGDNEVFIETPRGARRVKLDPNNRTSIEVPLERLFKYPAWKFPGKYAEENTSISGSIVNQNSPNYGTQTVNNLPSPRTVMPEKEEDFRNALRAFPHGAIGVIKAATSDDVAPLEAQIKQLAHDAGWGVNTFGQTYVGGATPQANGLECYFDGDWSSPMGRAFKAALEAANLHCKYFDRAYSLGGATFNEGTPTIVIGRNVSPSR